MKVKRIRLKGFMKHKDTTVELPDCGVVLVTGKNGSGKSSIPEGVATAAWGKTLRGTDPWSTKNGSVNLALDDLWIERAQKAKNNLAWGSGEESEKYGTTTKAQDALSRMIGDFDVWRRTHVFSSSDAAAFTMSTDAERKLLLEQLLGLGKFGDALALCRTDLKRERADMMKREMTLTRLRAEVEGEEKRLQDAEGYLADLPAMEDISEAAEKLNRLGVILQASQADHSRSMKEVRSLEREISSTETAAAMAQGKLEELKKGSCIQCGRPYPEDEVQAAVAEAQKSVDDLDRRVEELASALGGMTLVTDDLDAENQRLRAKMGELEQIVNPAQESARQIKRAEEVKAQVTASLEQKKQQLTDTEQEAVELAEKVKVLEAAEEVLGTKGVRSFVLARVLDGIEQVANSWLSRIAGPGFQLHLKPNTELKKGGISDAISMEIEGAGGGHGYKASSGGERRRLDVALLLALAEVSQAANAVTPGTLFLDEVFDALDEEGVDDVRDVIMDLAKDRALVIISHNPAVTTRIPNVMHLYCEDGKLLHN